MDKDIKERIIELSKKAKKHHQKYNEAKLKAIEHYEKTGIMLPISHFKGDD